MRKLALILSLVLLNACSTYTWRGQAPTPDQRGHEGRLTVRDIENMSDEHASKAFWRDLRRRVDGTTNAFARDLTNIRTTFSRHFLNYSDTDPLVNYPTNQSRLSELGRFGVSVVGGILPIR